MCFKQGVKEKNGSHFGMQDNQKSIPVNEKELIDMCQCSCNILLITFCIVILC